jgi:hypothetical protein
MESEILKRSRLQRRLYNKGSEEKEKWKNGERNDTRCVNSAGQKKEEERKYKEVELKKNGERKKEKIKENKKTA